MKRKLCLVMVLVLALSCVVTLPVWGAQDAQDMSWAVLTYTYDPDTEGQTPQSGKLTLEGEQNYLHRCSTIAWDAENAILFINDEPCEGGRAYLGQAGRYELTVTHKQTEDSVSYTVELLPVVKALIKTGEDNFEERYFSFDEKTKKFASLTFLQYPTFVCENANAKITVDDGVKDAETVVMSGATVERLGTHTLRFTSNGRAWIAPYCVSVCTAQTVFNEALGKNCLELCVGEFPGEFSVTLDGATPLAAGSTHVLSQMGQHKLDVKLNGRTVEESGAVPSRSALCLQMAILLPSSEIEEPFVLNLSRWDAKFYVDGKPVEGDYRIDSAGEHIFVAVDENGTRIENAFLVKTSRTDFGISHTELKITFYNGHHLYAFLLALPALALVAAAVYFFLQRRRIV